MFKREPQSAYWCQIQSGMYVLVASFHVEDCENISDEEKAKLIEMFDREGLPHIITESHIVISPDTQHGFAMVQHFHQEIFIKYLKKYMPTITRCFCRSDGCRSQYKGRHHFGFLSTHGIAEGITTTWSWFCSCHGKCLVSHTHLLVDIIHIFCCSVTQKEAPARMLPNGSKLSARMVAS